MPAYSKLSDQQKRARAFAINRHGKQQYGTLPYSVHLDEVASIAAAFGDQAVVIAYLHDVVEDTTTTVEDIAAEFGPFVSQCVAILTDETGKNRQERKAKTYAKMARVSGKPELALIVKAADRLANLRACVTQAEKKRLALYQKEHPVFRQSVYRPDLCEGLWLEIEALLRQ